MKFSAPLLLASMATAANAAAVGRVNPTLGVTLERESNSGVKLSVRNNGLSEIKLLNKGTLLDDGPTEKLHVYRGVEKKSFHGVRKRVNPNKDLDKITTPLKAGETIEVRVDAASLHDLRAGGSFNVFAKGSIPYTVDGVKINGVAHYSSNSLSMDVDGAEAEKVELHFGSQAKRTQLQDDCGGAEGQALQTALTNCQNLASQAAEFARSGDSAKIIEYFKVDGNGTRGTVAARLDAVANECGSTTEGATTYQCTQDVAGACDSNVLAYTLPSENVVVNCGIYYDLPDVASECHQQDKATTTLHEFTHAPGVFEPGTADNGYGYDAATALSPDEALNNADTYALFVNAIDLGC